MAKETSTRVEGTAAWSDRMTSAQGVDDSFPWSVWGQLQHTIPSGMLEYMGPELCGGMENLPNEVLASSQVAPILTLSSQALLKEGSRPKEQIYFCWQHGCQGRSFTNLSNYKRHCREQSTEYAKPTCSRCGKEFLRERARDDHYNQKRCRVVSIDANGVAILTPLSQSGAER